MNTHDEDRAGDTAIKHAVCKGYTEIVEILLAAGADPTISGWMGISAVDQAWNSVNGDHQTIREIRAMLRDYPSALRDRVHEENRKKRKYPI